MSEDHAEATAMEIPVAFEYLGHKGNLQVMSKGHPRRLSHMRVGFVGTKRFVPDGFIRVASLPAFDLVVNPGGWNAAEVTDERLKSKYLVFASSKKVMKELYVPGRIESILAITAELGGFPTGVLFGKSTLQVEKVCTTARPQDQLKLIYRVIDILDSLVGMPTRKAGEIAAGRAPAIDMTGAMCQICGMELTVRVVFCEGCVTPHHRECWEYLGGCSTFGCFRRLYKDVDSMPRETIEVE